MPSFTLLHDNKGVGAGSTASLCPSMDLLALATADTVNIMVRKHAHHREGHTRACARA
jgi:hypothetical protein